MEIKCLKCCSFNFDSSNPKKSCLLGIDQEILDGEPVPSAGCLFPETKSKFYEYLSNVKCKEIEWLKFVIDKRDTEIMELEKEIRQLKAQQKIEKKDREMLLLNQNRVKYHG